DLGERGDGLHLGVALLVGCRRAGQRQQRAGSACLTQSPEAERRRRPDRRAGVGEGGDEQLDRRRVPDAAGRERRLAAHGRVGVVEPVAQQRPVEAPGVGGGEQAGEGTDQRFVHLLRGRARRRQPYKKKEGGWSTRWAAFAPCQASPWSSTRSRTPTPASAPSPRAASTRSSPTVPGLTAAGSPPGCRRSSATGTRRCASTRCAPWRRFATARSRPPSPPW